MNFIKGWTYWSVIFGYFMLCWLFCKTTKMEEVQTKQYTLDSLRYELEIKEAVKRDSVVQKLDVIYHDVRRVK